MAVNIDVTMATRQPGVFFFKKKKNFYNYLLNYYIIVNLAFFYEICYNYLCNSGFFILVTNLRGKKTQTNKTKKKKNLKWTNAEVGFKFQQCWLLLEFRYFHFFRGAGGGGGSFLSIPFYTDQFFFFFFFTVTSVYTCFDWFKMADPRWWMSQFPVFNIKVARLVFREYTKFENDASERWGRSLENTNLGEICDVWRPI